MASESCTATCHSATKTAFPHFLKYSFPEKLNDAYIEEPSTYDLCFQCHESSLLSQNISTIETRFRNDVLENGEVKRENLHWLHVVSAGGSDFGGSCSLCHDPHGASQKFNLRSSVELGGDKVVIEYQGNENGGTCAQSCHESATYQRIE